MTDNEKAATFIGWEPQRCHHKDFDGICYIHLTDSEHGIAAPDMSKPENYMRALEALADRQNETDTASPDIGYRYSGGWFCDIQSGDLGYSDTPGEAAVKALAVLYDAEHLS